MQPQLFLLDPSPALTPCLAFCSLSIFDLIWREMKKDGGMTMVSAAAVVAHAAVFLWQAMYQLAPDEKRRDCGLNVLDTYFNNGVSFAYTYLSTDLEGV